MNDVVLHHGPVGAALASDPAFQIVAAREDVIEACVVGRGAAALARSALAFVERLSAQNPAIRSIRIVSGLTPCEISDLKRAAGALPIPGCPDGFNLQPSLVWQIACSWLPHGAAEPYPLRRVVTNGRGHPLRPPKPNGIVYARRIPWLDRTLRFRTATPADAPVLHRWMNDPRVAAIWDEAGPEEKHHAYLAALLADPHMLPLIGEFDGVPFGWFEAYFAAENRLGPLYAAEPWDRGWHVAIGEGSCRGAAFVSAWLPSLMHYLFLDEPRTQRIVGEPRSDHTQQIRNLQKSGFARIGTVTFPHKQAALVMLTRERFFDDGLWAPGAAEVLSRQLRSPDDDR